MCGSSLLLWGVASWAPLCSLLVLLGLLPDREKAGKQLWGEMNATEENGALWLLCILSLSLSLLTYLPMHPSIVEIHESSFSLEVAPSGSIWRALDVSSLTRSFGITLTQTGPCLLLDIVHVHDQGRAWSWGSVVGIVREFC